MALQLDLLVPPDAPRQPQAPRSHRVGEPLLLPLESVEENPQQPRLEFDPQTLQELAETIAERGVRQPISVRAHPVKAGRWMLNFGARRLRASRIAGKTVIPAYVDETVDTYDQVIENEQREGLKPLELALFIERRLQAGDSRVEIARRLGKNASHVTRVCALIDAPEWLMRLYREGRCRGLLELYELRRLYEEHRTEVEAWDDGASAVGRTDIERLKRSIAAGRTRNGVSPEETRATKRPSAAAAPSDAQEPSAVTFATYGEGVRTSTPEFAPCKEPREPGRSALVGPTQEQRFAPCKAFGEPTSTAANGVPADDRFAPCKSLRELQLAAFAALQTLQQAMSEMEALPVHGEEALRDLRAKLIELATSGAARPHAAPQGTR